MFATILAFVLFAFLLAAFAGAPGATIVGVILILWAFYALPTWFVWTVIGIIISAVIVKGVLV